MINPHWLKLPMFRTNLKGPKNVRVIEIWLYFPFTYPRSSQIMTEPYVQTILRQVTMLVLHYENTPIQLYRKFHL